MGFKYAALVSALSLGASCMTINKAPNSAIEARATWTFLGCYIDNVSGRALTHGVSVPGGSGAMTNEACQTACGAAGYTLAGTEYAGECWCDNTVQNGGGPAPDGSAGCKMACKGNTAEICGGPNRLDVYSSGSSTPPPPPSGKRGLAFTDGNSCKSACLANLFKGYPKVSWGYDWGIHPLGLDPYFEYVPMKWNGVADSAWDAAVHQAGVKNLLAFNEPDLTYSQSANMQPNQAAADYKTYLMPYVNIVKLGSPNVLWNNDNSYTSGGSYNSRVWEKDFEGNCTGCHFDWAGIHYYQDCYRNTGSKQWTAQDNINWFKGNVTNAWQALNRPLWITEFQCTGGSEQDQITFLQAVLPWLDAQSYVARYAYFGAFTGFLVNTAGTALSNLGTVYATT